MPVLRSRRVHSARACRVLRAMDQLLTINNSADVRTLGICAAKCCLLYVVWQLYPSLGYFGRALALLAQFLSGFFVATMVHNAMHCDVFGNPLVEVVWRMTLTTIFGTPVEAYRPTHNANHHVFTQHDKDHLHTTQMTYKWHFLNLILFFPTVYPEIFRLESEYVAQQFKKRSMAFVRYVIQAILCHGCTLFLMWIDWRRGVLCWFLPNVLSIDAIVTMNMLQHDGCETIEVGEHRGQKMNVNNSRNFTGPVINWLTCNNGFHTIHHMQSNTHWSQYPALHKKLIEPTMDPSLNEQCLLRYLWRTYFWPGTLPAHRRSQLTKDSHVAKQE